MRLSQYSQSMDQDQNCHQKVQNRGFYFCPGELRFRFSYFNLGVTILFRGAKPNKASLR